MSFRSLFRRFLWLFSLILSSYSFGAQNSVVSFDDFKRLRSDGSLRARSLRYEMQGADLEREQKKLMSTPQFFLRPRMCRIGLLP